MSVPQPRETPPPAPGGWNAGDFPAAEEMGARRLPHLAFTLIAAFFVFAFAWASISEIDEVARGEGRVIARSQVQLAQNLEGGILSEILVREGDSVQKDQVLMRIDPTRFVSAFREGEQGTLALKAKIARLHAEANRARLDMPSEVLKGSPVLARQEQSLLESRRRDLASRNDILRQQLSQRESELVELRAREARLKETLDLARREIKITAPLVKEGVVSEVELLRLEREQSRIQTDLDGATLSIPRVQAAIEEARKKIDDNELAFRAQASTDLSQARAELAKLAETIPALEDRVTRTTVRSPVKGIVKAIPNKTVGGVVQPGTPMVEIVPVEDTLVVETRIRPSDIAFVTVDQQAVVKITAYDYSIYGGLDGKIEYVSADSIQPQQGDPYYIAHVRTNANSLHFRNRTFPVIPGMTATVDVLTGKKTVLYYLLKPVNKARERALTER